MNVALIFAGGTGQRMNNGSTPKQFLELHGKPIMIYTLEIFEKHPDIDGVVVVCLESWIPYLDKMLNRFEILKVKAIVPGGSTGQESIKNGLLKLNELYSRDVIVLVHDGVRPLVTAETISNNIACAKKNGNAITVAPVVETIIVKTETNHVAEIFDRSMVSVAKAPQCFILGDIVDAHRRAEKDNVTNMIDSASLMKHYGAHLHMVEGPIENIKITTPIDFYTFRAIMDAKENLQIFG